MIKTCNYTNLGIGVPIFSFAGPPMLNLKYVQPEANPLPDANLLPLGDDSKQPEAPVSEKRKDTSPQKTFHLLPPKTVPLLTLCRDTCHKGATFQFKCLRFPTKGAYFQ